MSAEVASGDRQADTASLPKHLSVLVGSLQGPAGLARNHDKYLAYPRPRRVGWGSVCMILCDTGPLVAAFNKADDDHSRCVRSLVER
jgi:hypothetical protein